MKQGLILVDIQNDYFVGGNMELADMEQAARKAGDLLAKFREKNCRSFMFNIYQYNLAQHFLFLKRVELK